MKVRSLELKNFRNLNDINIFPDEGVNIIYGENAQGKTNILESVWLFSGLKSFRGAKDNELIRFNESFARMKCCFEDSKRENKAEIKIETRRSVKLNGVQLKSPAEIMGKFSAVVFAPSNMTLIKDGPEQRRKFIDAAICQIKPVFAPVLAEYNRLVKQRNSLLRDVQFASALLDMLDVLDERLAFTGEEIIKERKEYLSLISPAAGEIYSGLSGGREEISLSYIKKGGEKEERPLSAILKENRKYDIINKTTSAGPHRDDIEIKLNGIPVRSYGSQGQQRSCAVALKLAEASVIEAVTGEQPVILLDDVMSELDNSRQDYILNHIKDRQVFITCCEPSTIMRLCSGKTFNIEKGNII